MANYIYNGIKLPALPEWDKETYPYAVIGRVTTNYLLRVAKSACYRTSAVYIPGPIMQWTCKDGVWSGPSELTASRYTFISSRTYWSNHNIFSADGTLYLAASEPIPVPTWIPDLTSMVLGWQIGGVIIEQRSSYLVDAFLINDVLYINDAKAELNNDILEVT